eukprot:2560801-Prymnesium_polylepis.1
MCACSLAQLRLLPPKGSLRRRQETHRAGQQAGAAYRTATGLLHAPTWRQREPSVPAGTRCNGISLRQPHGHRSPAAQEHPNV